MLYLDSSWMGSKHLLGLGENVSNCILFENLINRLKRNKNYPFSVKGTQNRCWGADDHAPLWYNWSNQTEFWRHWALVYMKTIAGYVSGQLNYFHQITDIYSVLSIVLVLCYMFLSHHLHRELYHSSVNRLAFYILLSDFFSALSITPLILSYFHPLPFVSLSVSK